MNGCLRSCICYPRSSASKRKRSLDDILQYTIHIQVGSPRDSKKSAREVVLPSLQSLPKPPEISPGSVLVYGEHSEPLLSGDSPLDVILAASRLGKGRLIATSHEYYLQVEKHVDNENIRRFYEACARWLLPSCKEAYLLPFDEIEGEMNLEEISITRCILVWRNCQQVSPNKEPSHIDLLKDWISRGGAMIMGFCPWGWCCLNPGLELDEHCDMQQFLQLVGLSFTNKVAVITVDSISVTGNLSSDAHLCKNVSDFASGKLCVPIDMINSSHIPISDRKRLLKSVASCCRKYEPVFPLNDITEKQKCSNMTEVLMAQCVTDQQVQYSRLDNFPGNCNIQLKEVAASFIAKSNDIEWHSTGFYTPAGVVLHVEISSPQASLKRWKVQIGCHTDELNVSLKTWHRPPRMCMSTDYTDNSHAQLCSPFGGLVYIVTNNVTPQNITVQLRNVVEAPFFNIAHLLDTSTRDDMAVMDTRWQTTDRLLSAPWGELSGKFCIITLPSASVRPLFNPYDVIHFWDTVVEEMCKFRGLDSKQLRRQRIVCDVQMNVDAYMHAGYPIVTLMDVATNCPYDKPPQNFTCLESPSKPPALLDLQTLTSTGNWGLFHELGHNMQCTSWTFDGVVEVTCNIFTLHLMRRICGVDVWIHPWLCNYNGPEDWQKYLTQYISAPSFAKWCRDPRIGLYVYAQLYNSFGWHLYHEIFKQYDRENITPHGQQNQVDMWWLLCSRQANYNLAPLCEFWGIPLSDGTRQELSGLTPALPDDDITRYFKQRTCHVSEKFTGLQLLADPAELIEQVHFEVNETQWRL